MKSEPNDKSQDRHPNSSFPALSRYLRLFADSPLHAEKDKPKLPVNPRHVEQIRVTTRKETVGTWIFPEFLHDGKWYYFYDGDKAVTCWTFNKHRIQQIERDWAKWLKRWLRSERLKIPFYQKTEEKKASEPDKPVTFKHHISLLQKKMDLPPEVVTQLQQAKTMNQLRRCLRSYLKGREEMRQARKQRQQMVVPEDFDA